MSDTRGAATPGRSAIFSAADIKRRLAEIEAAKAAEELRRQQAEEEQQKKVMAEFQQPPARTAEQLLPLAGLWPALQSLLPNEHLKPLGFGLKAEVVEYPGGMPGDIGLEIAKLRLIAVSGDEGRPRASAPRRCVWACSVLLLSALDHRLRFW